MCEYFLKSASFELIQPASFECSIPGTHTFGGSHSNDFAACSRCIRVLSRAKDVPDSQKSCRGWNVVRHSSLYSLQWMLWQSSIEYSNVTYRESETVQHTKRDGYPTRFVSCATREMLNGHPESSPPVLRGSLSQQGETGPIAPSADSLQ